MSRFYVTLASNVSSVDYFLENTITNYVTKLPQRNKLDGQWGVGLVEISYTYSWLNLPDNELIELWYLNKDYSKSFAYTYEIEDDKIYQVEEHIDRDDIKTEKNIDDFIHVARSSNGGEKKDFTLIWIF